MTKKKKTVWQKIKTQIFGRVFNIWDIILLGLILPYFYLVFIGFTPSTGLERVYYNIIGPSAAIGIVISVLIQSLQQKAKKSRKKML